MKPVNDSQRGLVQIPIAEDYENAVEILDRDGWCQGRFTVDKKFCMGGAISKAISERLGLNYLPMINWSQIDQDVDLSGETIPSFNDARGRTKEEVQDRLMRAAKKLRDEGR